MEKLFVDASLSCRWRLSDLKSCPQPCSVFSSQILARYKVDLEEKTEHLHTKKGEPEEGRKLQQGLKALHPAEGQMSQPSS